MGVLSRIGRVGLLIAIPSSSCVSGQNDQRTTFGPERVQGSAIFMQDHRVNLKAKYQNNKKIFIDK
jgi:hypothetical protein